MVRAFVFTIVTVVAITVLVSWNISRIEQS